MILCIFVQSSRAEGACPQQIDDILLTVEMACLLLDGELKDGDEVSDPDVLAACPEVALHQSNRAKRKAFDFLEYEERLWPNGIVPYQYTKKISKYRLYLTKQYCMFVNPCHDIIKICAQHYPFRDIITMCARHHLFCDIITMCARHHPFCDIIIMCALRHPLCDIIIMCALHHFLSFSY